MLEQTQNEMRSHCDIPFLRFDSVGVQHVKQDHFVSDLRKYHWNAVLAGRASRIVAQPAEKTHGCSLLFFWNSGGHDFCNSGNHKEDSVAVAAVAQI